MKYLLLVAAGVIASAALTVPAAAQSFGGSSHMRLGADDRDRDRDSRHHRRDGGGTLFIGPVAPDAWSFYNNRGWRPDSYNDWWHDRPDRAFPRWVQQNQNCTPDRMWWSGSGWRC